MGFTQDISIEKHSEQIEINEDGSFLRKVSIKFKKSDEPIIFPIFYDYELEKLSDIKLVYRKGKKIKTIENITMDERVVDLDYYTSKRVKSILIPPGVSTVINYTVTCSELMYFSHLPFFSHNFVDTLEYKVQVPNSHDFIYNIINKDSLKSMVMDSIDLEKSKGWNFSTRPQKVESDMLSLFGIFKDQKNPLMRILLVPEHYNKDGLKFMNDWYLDKVDAKRGLNRKAIEKIDELTENVSESSEILKILYDYVHQNFKYVAIEIGMGAFIPTHANEVFLRKEGDCKDLSNFLSEALNYKGIKSEIALAATYHHISDCDFPSLSSANHVVCVAYLGDKTIILDPTDPVHYPESPVESLQNRSILVVNDSGGQWFKINSFENEQNLIDYNIGLKADTKNISLTGLLKVSYNGITGNFLKRNFLQSENEDVYEFTKDHLKNIIGNQSVTNLIIKENDQDVKIESEISVSGRIFNDGKQKILILDFLPSLIETSMTDAILEGSHLGSNFKKSVRLTIGMNETFEPFKPRLVHLNDEHSSLSIEIKALSDTQITCTYDFQIQDQSITKANIESINASIALFKQTINEPLVLETTSK